MHGGSDLGTREFGFLADGGEMGALVRARDWSATPLGPIEAWPQPLRTLVGVMLGSNQPMFVAWGPERTLLYNEPYADILAFKHPFALGRDLLDVWHEIRADLTPIVEQAYAGRAVHMDDIAFVMERNGSPEETHFAFSYTPVFDEAGAVAGFFCPCREITNQVLAERRQGFRLALEERLRDGVDPDAVMTAAVTMLGEHLRADRVGYGQVQSDDATIRLSHCYAVGVEPLLGDFPLEGFGPKSIARQRCGETEACPDVLADPAQNAAVWAAIDTRAFVSVPLVRDGRFRASLYVNAREPRRWTTEDVALIEDVAARTWAAVESAHVAATLRESEERYRALVEASSSTVWTTDAQGLVVEDSPSWRAFTGQTREEWLGWGWVDAIHPDDRDYAKRQWAEAAASGSPVDTEFRLRHAASGGWRWTRVRAVPLKDRDGRVTSWVGTNFDIEHQKTAEATLAESEARFRNMADRAPVMMWVTDPSGFCTHLNRRWYEFTGQAPGEGEGYGWLRAVHPHDRPLAEQAFVSANAEQRDYRVEFRLRRADGAYRWTIDAAAARFSDAGDFLGYVGSVFDIDERRESEERLALNEERLRLATDAADMGFWDVDTVNEELFWPPRVKAMFGISPHVPVTMADFYAGLHPDDRAHTGAAFAAACDPVKRALYDVEYRTIGKEDSAIRWVAAKGRGRFDPDGRCVRVIGTAMDITTRKQTEVALRESEARVRALTDHLPAGMVYQIATGANGGERRFLYVSQSHEKLTGIPAEAVLADSSIPYNLILPEDRDELAKREVAALRGKRPFDAEARIRRADGETRWCRIISAPREQPDGSLIWDGIQIDVTEQKLLELRLRELNETLERRVEERTADLADSQTRFRGIFDSALQFMALLTPSGMVVEVNQTALDWSQLSPSDIVGKPFWLAAPMRGNPALQAAIKAGIQRAAAGETVREEHEMRGAGEVRAVVDFSLKPVQGKGGEAIWLVAEGRDITELKRTQDALRQAQKLEAVGQLTGGVAHDFNNLLTIIKSSTELLRRPDLPEARRRRYVEAISDTVDRASKLTGQLLAFARRQALKPEVFDPASRIRPITEMLRTLVGSRIEIVTEVACERCFIEADASQFETALVNLAVNARDAMDGEGRLTLRVADGGALPALRTHILGQAGFVAISITDTGCGIEADKLTQIFEPFFTTKEVGKGTGLGLSQVYGFAKQSGGDVDVHSEVGRGTTFTLYLPRVEGRVAADETGQMAALGPVEDGHGRRVLVVEDNAEVGTFSTQLLQDLGYATTWAANAAQALQILRERTDGFDVVFSDVVMPGMSGVELGQEIRRLYPGLPVVLTSGYSHVLAEEGRHGFELLHKPYAVEDLSRLLRRVTQGRRAP